MKRYIVFIGFALTLTGIPLLSWGGLSTPGTVTISSNGMQGSFNVRFNSATGNSYILLNAGPPNGSGIILAHDSSTNAYFVCSLSRTDALYPTLEKLVYGAVDGTTISVFKNSGGKCTSIETTKSSQWLH